MAELTTVARPYAKAAFEHAMSAQNLSQWSSMLEFTAAVVQNQDMARLLDSPRATWQQQAEAVLTVAKEQLTAEGENFIRLLAENRRLPALPAIAEIFEHLKAEFEKTVDVKVTSAVPLTAEQSQQLTERLSSKLGRQVQLHTQIDQDVIGGMVIKANDMVIDGSVRGRLNKLAESLKA